MGCIFCCDDSDTISHYNEESYTHEVPSITYTVTSSNSIDPLYYNLQPQYTPTNTYPDLYPSQYIPASTYQHTEIYPPQYTLNSYPQYNSMSNNQTQYNIPQFYNTF